jgi:lysophospholipase L1-like esterase
LLISLGLAEGVVRILYGSPMPERRPILRVRASPTRGWEMMPNELHYTYQHPVHVNSLGLRGPEVEPRGGSPYETRVLALGDSNIYGQGVADEDTLPTRLEHELEARDGGGRTWRVVNGGLRAHDTRQELALLSELGPAIDPDVVVLFWFWNDIRERNVEATNRRLEASGPIAFDVGAPLQGRKALQWDLLQLTRRSALVMTVWDLWRARNWRPPGERLVERGLERLAGYLRELHQLGLERGFRPFVLLIPDSRSIIEPHFSDPIVERAGELAADAGLPVLSLKSAVAAVYERGAGDLPILPYDGHYTGDANGGMARATADFLLSQLPAEGSVRPPTHIPPKEAADTAP